MTKFEMKADEYMNKSDSKTALLLKKIKLSVTDSEANVLIAAFKQCYTDAAETATKELKAIYKKQRNKRIDELQKEKHELLEQVSFLKDNLRVAREDREQLQLEIGKGLKEFVHDCTGTALRFLADEIYVERFDNAKEIIKEYIRLSLQEDKDIETNVKLFQRAEAFIKE